VSSWHRWCCHERGTSEVRTKNRPGDLLGGALVVFELVLGRILSVTMVFRVVNLAQRIELGPSPHEFGPEKPTRRKSIHYKSPQSQKANKSLMGQDNPCVYFLNMKIYVFFKYTINLLV